MRRTMRLLPPPFFMLVGQRCTKSSWPYRSPHRRFFQRNSMRVFIDRQSHESAHVKKLCPTKRKSLIKIYDQIFQNSHAHFHAPLVLYKAALLPQKSPIHSCHNTHNELVTSFKKQTSKKRMAATTAAASPNLVTSKVLDNLYKSDFDFVTQRGMSTTMYKVVEFTLISTDKKGPYRGNPQYRVKMYPLHHFDLDKEDAVWAERGIETNMSTDIFEMKLKSAKIEPNSIFYLQFLGFATSKKTGLEYANYKMMKGDKFASNVHDAIAKAKIDAEKNQDPVLEDTQPPPAAAATTHDAPAPEKAEEPASKKVKKAPGP